MFFGNSFVSYSIKDISKHYIIPLSIIFFELYRRVDKFFLKRLGVEKSFARIFPTEFLSSFLSTYRWKLEDITYKYHLLTSEWLFTQTLISRLFGKIIFHQEVDTVDGICVDHTDFVDDDKGYVE
jgi:hypothetical protein